MKKTVMLVAVVLAAPGAYGATRRLASDCTVPGTFAPSPSAPFDLDWCRLDERDNVRELFLDIANRWPGQFAVRAPSRSVTLEMDTTNWTTDPGTPVSTFVFLEDQERTNKLHLKMPAAPRNKYVMWQFNDFNVVRIGGTNLSVTFEGTHPGLANGNPETNQGLLSFMLMNGAYGNSPDLLDVRANVRMAEDYGLIVAGDAYAQQLGGAANRIKQANVAGLFWNAPVVFLGGVSKLWLDPINFRVSDPYARTMGWDGAVAMTVAGSKIGCSNYNLDQIRTSAGAANHADEITGGVTVEWGGLGFVPRNVGNIGKGPTDPFVIRIKDLGMTGPGTGYPEGVRVKPSGEALFFKGDPAGEMGRTAPFRFIRFESLRSQYGHGVWPSRIADGLCAPGTPSNNFVSGWSNLLRLEANRNASTSRYVTSYYDIELKGDWTTPFTVNGDLTRGPLLYTAFRPQDAPGPATPDRSYGHVIRVAADTTITDTIALHDTITATGPGKWTGLSVASMKAEPSGATIPAKDNKVEDTNIAGSISIEAGSTGTTVRNVRFIGGARSVVQVGSGSDVSMSEICAPPGSTIEGQGQARLNGAMITLPFVLTSEDNCSVGSERVPFPPSDVTVQ